MGSNSRSFSWGLVLAILLVAALDLTVRALETRLSGDIANTRSFPERVAELSAAPGEKVAAIGNSLIGDGLDKPVFLANWLKMNPGAGSAIKLVPDGSGIWDWHCIVHYELANASQGPDLVLIGFGWNQLSDQNGLSITRAFNGLCPATAMWGFSALSGRIGVNDWLEMAAVKTSKLYAHREPIRHRILQNVIPDYRRMTWQLNARAGDVGDAEGTQGRRSTSYNALSSILEKLSGRGSRVVLVAMPVMNPYEIDRGLCNVISDTPHRFLDMRYAVPSTHDLYRDSLHLNEAGARLFSERLAAELSTPNAPMRPCSI